MTARELLTQVSQRVKPAEVAAERAGYGSLEEMIAAHWRSAAKALTFLAAKEEEPKKTQPQEPLQATCGCGLMSVQRVGSMEVDGVVHRYGKPCHPKGNQ